MLKAAVFLEARWCQWFQQASQNPAALPIKIIRPERFQKILASRKSLHYDVHVGNHLCHTRIKSHLAISIRWWSRCIFSTTKFGLMLTLTPPFLDKSSEFSSRLKQCVSFVTITRRSYDSFKHSGFFPRIRPSKSWRQKLSQSTFAKHFYKRNVNLIIAIYGQLSSLQVNPSTCRVWWIRWCSCPQ